MVARRSHTQLVVGSNPASRGYRTTLQSLRVHRSTTELRLHLINCRKSKIVVESLSSRYVTLDSIFLRRNNPSQHNLLIITNNLSIRFDLLRSLVLPLKLTWKITSLITRYWKAFRCNITTTIVMLFLFY